MRTLLKCIWIMAIFINLSAVLWFILGSTANFQRGIDLISTAVLIFYGVPSIILIYISVVFLFKGWPLSSWRNTLVISIIIVCLLALSPTLYKYVNTNGWLTESIRTDSLQITEDGKYEYQIELVNVFQRNSFARLYLKNISTGEEVRIPLDIPVTEIKAYLIRDVIHWVTLMPASETNLYILHTTKDFPLRDKKFEFIINVDKNEVEFSEKLILDEVNRIIRSYGKNSSHSEILTKSNASLMIQHAGINKLEWSGIDENDRILFLNFQGKPSKNHLPIEIYAVFESFLFLNQHPLPYHIAAISCNYQSGEIFDADSVFVTIITKQFQSLYESIEKRVRESPDRKGTR